MIHQMNRPLECLTWHGFKVACGYEVFEQFASNSGVRGLKYKCVGI